MRAETEANKLFFRGRELVKEGNYAEACPLFEQSMRLAPTLGISINVADCWKKIGRLAEALALFEKVEPEAEAQQHALLERVRSSIAELKGKLAHVTIDAGALPDGTVVELDGKPVKLGTRLAIDPKEHRIQAKGARTVRYVARAGHEGMLKLETDHRPRPREVYLFGGIGAGALLLGTITGITVIKRKNRAFDGTCDESGTCTNPADADLLNSARGLSHVTTVLFLVGLGAAGGAGYLEWRNRRERPPILIEPGADRVTVSVGGRF